MAATRADYRDLFASSPVQRELVARTTACEICRAPVLIVQSGVAIEAARDSARVHAVHACSLAAYNAWARKRR